ncbi:MAG: hypothetical protein CMH30_01900 [Micavibrio sp.]|nr:hypothetical protein [Micavibrio sp.]
MYKENTQNELIVFVHGIHDYLGMRGVPLLRKDFGHFFMELGYDTQMFKYAPFGKSIENLADDLQLELAVWLDRPYDKIHFVTHSMGGLIVHELLTRTAYKIDNLGHVVSISPPFYGSPIADCLFNHPQNLIRLVLGNGFNINPLEAMAKKQWEKIYEMGGGTAGKQLTHEYRTQLHFDLPDHSLGIITGNKTGDLFGRVSEVFSAELEALNFGESDGLVSVASAIINEDLQHFCVVDEDHISILESPVVRQQILSFLQEGQFNNALKNCRYPDPKSLCKWGKCKAVV